MSTAPRIVSPHLKLVFVDDGGDDQSASLSPYMTLSQFFWQWYKPVVLDAKDRDPKTTESYVESLGWWASTTGDPPLHAIDQLTIAAFSTGLHQGTFKRGPASKPSPLEEGTIHKHLVQVRRILYRTGPATDPRRPTAKLVGDSLYVEAPAIKRRKPKAAFPLPIARDIVAAAARMPKTRKFSARQHAHFWCALVAVLYYTGVRIGTALKLNWSMLEQREDGPWLIIPGAIIDKTKKPLDKFLHPAALEALTVLQPDRSGLMLDWRHCQRWLAARHELLQGLAGLPEEKWLGFHGWRRTHGMEMARVGAKIGVQIAQRALDHEDERTTRASYVDIEPELIRTLPPLMIEAPPAPANDPQLRLF